MLKKIPLLTGIALLLLSGMALGFWLGDKPPLDWQKWGVLGTWFSAIMTALVALIATWMGATLPRRFAHAAKVERFGPMAEEIMAELEKNFDHLTTLKEWVEGGEPHHMPHAELMVEARDKFLDHVREEHPYIGQIVDDAYKGLREATDAFLTSDGYGGDKRVAKREEVKKGVLSAKYPVASDKLERAIRHLHQTFRP